MGLGLLGRGLGDAKFLAEMGAELIVTDLKTAEQLKTSVDSLNKFVSSRRKVGTPTETSGLKPITYHLGSHDLKDFQNRDLILKAAGVPLDSIYIAEARKNNIPVKMSTSWFAKIAMDYGVKIVGITGTRGKSTVTQLIYEILQGAQGQSLKTQNPRTVLGRDPEIFLGGNVRGVSTLPLLKKLKKGDVVVMELDSWQLQGFGDEKISPSVAVFTTFYPDHLNYYKGDLSAYYADKAKIYTHQKKGDILIVGEQVEQINRGLPSVVLPKNWKLKIPGEHNRYNAGLALATARALNISEKVIKKAVESFKGVSGRLEFIKNWKGRKIYNDTTSTTPEATLVALKALSKNKNTVLIMGGADKTLDMTKLVEALPRYCKKVILLPGTGTDKIMNQGLTLGLGFLRRDLKNMEEAISEAVKVSKKGDVILLSPAFASFGLFKNEFDRGEQFNKLVKKLK